MDINSDNKASLLSSFGAHSAGEIPVLIPNTEVKPSSADYTGKTGKLGRCQIIKITTRKGGILII